LTAFFFPSLVDVISDFLDVSKESTHLPNAFKNITKKIKVNPETKLNAGKYLIIKRT
jgi:hypothetical protein